MKRNTLGDTIRQLRKRANMTQEELADGICSAVSISRIENGTQMPSGNTLDSILEKLGSSTYQLCDIYYKTDVQLAFEDKFKQIELLIQRGNFKEAKAKLAELDITTNDTPKTTQMYFMMEGILELQYYRNPKTAVEKLLQGLYKTKQELNLENFRAILLTEQEANILNVLLAAYLELGKFNKAISLGKELVFSLKKQESSLKEFQVMRINALINLSQCMFKNKDFEEALIYIEEAEQLSLLGVEQVLLPEILYIKARIFFESNKIEECKIILCSIIPYMELIGKDGIAALARDFAKSICIEIPTYIIQNN